MKNIKENIRICIYNINIRKLAVYTIYIILYSFHISLFHVYFPQHLNLLYLSFPSSTVCSFFVLLNGFYY